METQENLPNSEEPKTESKFIETKKFKDWFWDLFSNPDGSGSTKRTAGWILLLFAVLTGAIGLYAVLYLEKIPYESTFITVFITVFTGCLTYGLGCFGLSNIDTSSYYKHVIDKLDRNKTSNPTDPTDPTNPTPMS